MRRAIPLLCQLCWALVPSGSAHALTLDLPAPLIAEETRREVPGSYPLPLGPFDGITVPQRQVEGAVDQRALQLNAPGMTTLAIMAPLRDQVVSAGFTIILDCQARACGGFDFRYATDVLPEPDMHVDTGDFRFLSAERGAEAVSILVSRSALSAYVQITQVTAAPAQDPPTAEGVSVAAVDLGDETARDFDRAAVAGSGIGAALDADGAAVLDDLVFASGAATLAEGDYPSLAALAAWLEANPDGTIALVGHTDASGSLTANIALSERRAEAVAQVLIDRFGADGDRITGEGVGFLAPRATNQTDEGRQKNRRVEVVVTSTR
ncbi:MAG: OmpA family protein [Rhodobacterales bacterium]|nr:OmpA family protein [Rhodobacterales bacterium]